MSVETRNLAVGSRIPGRLPPPLLFALVWLILPNLAFVPLWIVGGPPRPLAIMVYIVVGVAARFLPLTAVALLLLGAIGFDVILTLSGIFNLAPDSLIYAIQFLPSLNLFASAQYALILLGLSAIFLVILWFVSRRRDLLAQASTIPALLGAIVLIAGEYIINDPPELGFGRYLAADAPFDSALKSSGLAEEIALSPGGRNITIVMVESLGRFADPAHERLLTAWLDSEDLRRRYRVETGYTPYYGSTTAAEIRELCGRWQDYSAFLDRRHEDCLPARLAAAGYETTAIHGFTSDMFNRAAWYPNLGFQRALFFEDLHQADDRICDGVFTGLCDTDLGDRVIEILRQANGRPQFVHWLTLNTHVPVPLDQSDNTLGCLAGTDPFDNAVMCRMAQLWLQLYEKVAAIALDENLPPTDFVIVGDHAPPLWSRRARALFVSGQVPWIVLRDRRSRSEQPQAPARPQP